jgi:wobble nucleotide-excising tRNase
MLQRIVYIRNVGRFRNCAAAGDVTFRRFTLIFAENGRGKTTLCAILRSLCRNDPAFVIGRTTLGGPGRPEVQLLTANGSIAFRDGAWEAAFQDIEVFDGTYVGDNLFVGDIIAADQRRNLYRVIVGAQGVTLAGRLNDLENQIRTKQNEIRDNRAVMQRHVPVGITVDGFIALAQDADIDTKIAAKEQDVQAAKRSAQLQQRAAATPVTVPAFPAAFAELLAKTFANVAADAEKRVGEQIERHKMHKGGETWLTQGLQFMAAEECPFCGQNIAAVDLIAAYRSFFSKEYHALRNEVTALDRQIDTALGDLVAAGIDQKFLENTGGVEFWQQYCELAAPAVLATGKAAEVMKALRESAQALLRTKAGTPLDAVAPDETFTQALAAFETLRTDLATYNAAVAGANAVITARKRQAQAANVREVETALAKLKAQKARYVDGVVALCAADRRLQSEKTALERDKTTAREQLDRHTAQVIAQYGQSINHYLERINAGFRITTPTHTYRGGPPSTSYQILINQNAVDLGDAATPLDRPSFKNTLSAGDRNTLALAFFLAQLSQDPGRANKVVVFDDPFTSMDSFRRSHTVHRIYRCGEICAQVVVLSHETGFLKMLYDRIAPADRKTLQLARIGEENTTIVEWDIDKAVQARYRADLETLQRFYSLGEGEQRDVIQKIRPALEGYCRNLYPAQFGEQELMGSMIGKIRAAGATHPLAPIVEDLDELNVYCRRYHHAENPHAATEPIDETELTAYVGRALKLVGCLL